MKPQRFLAQPNRESVCAGTPLHAAAVTGNLPAAEALTKAGAEANMVDRYAHLSDQVQAAVAIHGLFLLGVEEEVSTAQTPLLRRRAQPVSADYLAS